MNYRESLQYIHSLGRFSILPGLERITALCTAVGEPQKRLRFIHIAGTNGKGSTSTMLANILRQGGKKVGLFTSPYVVSFLERIQIDGRQVTESDFAWAMSRLEPIVADLAKQDMQPTEFEVITAAAFMIFEKAGCDICVLEVGLGGRLDSTNIISTPLVSVITSISLDHTAILGNTVEKIAAEKCGIIKPNGTTVCYPLQESGVFEVVTDTCKAQSNRLIIPDTAKIENVTTGVFGSSFYYKGMKITLSMGGDYQVYNAVTAIEAAKAIGATDEEIAKGIEQTAVPARMEIICRKPVVILDGGHNEDGGKAVAESLKNGLEGKRILAVIGMMADKSFDGYLSYVAPLCSSIITVSVADNPRSMSAQGLAQAAEKYCAHVTAEENALEAVKFAAKQLDKYDCLLVCGSLYLAGEVRDELKKLFDIHTI